MVHVLFERAAVELKPQKHVALGAEHVEQAQHVPLAGMPVLTASLQHTRFTATTRELPRRRARYILLLISFSRWRGVLFALCSTESTS